jgi:hypothetical protein
MDPASTSDVCPQCGGEVKRRAVSFIGLLDEDAARMKTADPTKEDESYVQSGTCTQCGIALSRPVGPRERPIAEMAATSPWRAYA